MKTSVYLVRHSEKMASPAGMTLGEFDRIQPLSVRGEQKAAALLELEELRGADAAVCSPFARTLSTLRYLLEADGITPTTDERLRELDFGDAVMAAVAGQPPKAGDGLGDIRARQWVEHTLAAPGGESVMQCRERMDAAIRGIAAANPGKKVLIGTHGAAICSWLTGCMEGIDDDYARTLPTPAVFRVIIEDEKITDVSRIEY